MRSHYQRRSLASPLIWTTVLLVMGLGAAWQFHWYPTNETDPTGLSFGPKRAAQDSAQKNRVQQASHETVATQATKTNDLFANQTEPDLPELPEDVPPFAPANKPDFSDFPRPPQLLPANPDAKPIPLPSRLAQTIAGESPPPDPSEELPDEFTPASSPIQLLAEENPSPVVSAAPLPEGMEDVAGQLKQIDEWMASSDPKQELQAHKELSTLYWDHPEWREALRSRIEKTAESIYFAKQPHYMTPYVIQPGDQLTKIGKLYNVPWEYLAALNEVDPKKIRTGQKLKVIKGPFAAVVDLHCFELTIQHHGFFVKRYKVGIGKDGTSPIGEFTIKNKLLNPTYYGPDGNVIAADDPKNPLGEYWIDIGDSYGIHGTIEPDSIGKAESKGCIRMTNEDAEEVYGFLGVGAKVIIRR